MSEVIFDEEPELTAYNPVSAPKARKGLISLVQSWGFAKDDKSANKILIIVAILSFSAAAFIIFMSRPGGGKLTPQERLQLQIDGTLPAD